MPAYLFGKDYSCGEFYPLDWYPRTLGDQGSSCKPRSGAGARDPFRTVIARRQPGGAEAAGG